MRKPNQKGYALFELIAIAGVLSIIGLAAWNIYQRQQKPGSTTQQTVSNVPVAPQISSTTDLDKASEVLDSTQIDTKSDTAQLDKDLASF